MSERGELLGLFIIEKPLLNEGVESEVGVRVGEGFSVVPMYEREGEPWKKGENGQFCRPGETQPYALVVDGKLTEVQMNS